MAKTRVTRKELLKKEDEFMNLSSRAIEYVKKHTRFFEIAGYCILALALVYAGIFYYMKRMNQKAQNTYNTAYYYISNSTGTAINKKDMAKAKEYFGKILDEYGLSHAATLVLPELGYVDFLEKKYDDAISKYKAYLAKTPGEPYRSLDIMALAMCYEQKGEYDNAIKALDEILSGPNDHFKEEAMLSLAREYRLKNNYSKSNEILKEFIKKFPSSKSISMAKAFIKS